MTNSVNSILKPTDIHQLWYILKLFQFICLSFDDSFEFSINFRFQLIIVPLNILLTTLISLEAVFVGLIERNFNLQLLGFVYIYYTLHMYLVIIAQVHAIVNSGAEGRFTGVLVHQALIRTNDADLIPKVTQIYGRNKHRYQHFNSFLARAFFNANIALKPKMRFEHNGL